MKEPEADISTQVLEIETVQDLAALGKRIRASWDNAWSLAEKAKTFASQAVLEAVLCGFALRQARKLMRHGQWLGWLERNCPQVSERTAYRWMALANPAHVTNLATAKGLRQAYLALGLLPEAEGSAGAGDSATVTFEGVCRWAGWWRKRVGDPHVVLAWPNEQRQALKEELKPLVALYQQLA